MEAGAGSAQPQQSAPARNGRNCAHPSSSQRSVPCRTTSYTPHKGRIKVKHVIECQSLLPNMCVLQQCRLSAP